MRSLRGARGVVPDGVNTVYLGAGGRGVMRVLRLCDKRVPWPCQQQLSMRAQVAKAAALWRQGTEHKQWRALSLPAHTLTSRRHR